MSLTLLTATAALLLLTPLLLQHLLTRTHPPTYTRHPHLCTPNELTFFHALRQAFPTLHIMSHVRLADIIDPNPNLPPKANRHAFHKIKALHIDFLLCHPRTLEILHTIELDDPSHHLPHRQRRDHLVNTALTTAHVPFTRFPTAPTYSPLAIRNTLTAPPATA